MEISSLTQQNKINWEMITLLITITTILLFGHKFISTKIDGNEILKQNNVQVPNDSFPLTGDWSYKDTGVGLKYVNDKYNFTPPQLVNNVMKGQITKAMEWMESVKTLNYEVIREGKLRITEPNNAHTPYEMDYNYNPVNQTLEVSDQGHTLIYTRNIKNTN